jgi:hypothetical protein
MFDFLNVYTVEYYQIYQAYWLDPFTWIPTEFILYF